MKAVTSHTMIQDNENKWALGQFNVHNIELALAAVRAAEEENAPIILAVGPSTFNYLGDISPLISAIHKMIENTTVPISLHLDHAKDLKMIRQALDLGFSSIMFDGSNLPYDENVHLTTKVAEMSHVYGASMEGEIGIVPAEVASPDEMSENFTNPDKAAHFAHETNIDLIAVSVGSVHGMESQCSSIDCGLIRELSIKLNCPQVLHGASGVLDKYLPDAIDSGIRKININTMLKVCFRDTVARSLKDSPNMDMLEAWTIGTEAVTECVRNRIRCFNATNRADAFRMN